MAEIVATLRITGPTGSDPVDYSRIVQDFQRLVEVMNRRYLASGGMQVNWHLEIPEMSGFTFNIAFEITVSADDIVTLLFDGGNGPIVKTISDTNAGATITTITATTQSGTPYLTPITITGDEAASFAFTNGGVCPCDLVVGATDLPLGSHIGIWTFTAPI
jgi:hypothetical protein